MSKKWIDKIKKAHLAVTSSVSHQCRLQSDRYFVWQEEAPEDLVADGKHCERFMTGSTDLFTKLEYDPWAEELEHAFDSCGIRWRRTATSYEPDTGFTHYEWVWKA